MHRPLAVAPHRPTQFESAVAAQPASHVTRQHSGLMAHTVLQQSLSEHPGRVCAVRQLSVPLPQFCAMLHGVKASVSEVAMATSAEDSVCTKFIGEVRQDQAVSGSISRDQGSIAGARCYPRFAEVPSSAASKPVRTDRHVQVNQCSFPTNRARFPNRHHSPCRCCQDRRSRSSPSSRA